MKLIKMQVKNDTKHDNAIVVVNFNLISEYMKPKIGVKLNLDLGLFFFTKTRNIVICRKRGAFPMTLNFILSYPHFT